MRVDVVSVPFAGHLFPLLDLAKHVQRCKIADVRVMSTEETKETVAIMQLAFHTLLADKGHKVREIAESTTQVGSNPFRLFGQLKQNLALLGDVQQELKELWRQDPPDLVIADFVAPIAGIVAGQLGIPWWTAMPSPCVLETNNGTPAYLGGWATHPGVYGQIRDFCGRKFVRLFKRSVTFLTRKQLRLLGFSRLYREDGLEAIYSPERILAFGIEAFEFHRHWPEHVQFIGPVTGCPPFHFHEPRFLPGKKHILVTLGTHLWWAKEQVTTLLLQLARSMSDCVFHFTRGKALGVEPQVDGNLHQYDFIPYDAYMNRYDAAIVHGGTGAVYSCLKSATPMLVWPHDFDQFDNAARIVVHRLGLRCRPSPSKMEADLKHILTDVVIRDSLNRIRNLLDECNPHASFAQMLKAFASRHGRHGTLAKDQQSNDP
jgi:UDP:flavonoid glycosyltransferase YjiC (YdhE family)